MMKSFINNLEIPRLQALWPLDHQTTEPVLFHVFFSFFLFLSLQSSSIWVGVITKRECCSFKKSTHTLLVMEGQTGDGHCHLLFNIITNYLWHCWYTELTVQVEFCANTADSTGRESSVQHCWYKGLTVLGGRVLCNIADTKGWQYWEGEFCATLLIQKADSTGRESAVQHGWQYRETESSVQHCWW